MRAGKLFVVALMAILTLSGAASESALAAHRKPHHGKYSHYKPGKNADLLGGKYKAPKAQKLPKHSYRKH